MGRCYTCSESQLSQLERQKEHGKSHKGWKKQLSKRENLKLRLYLFSSSGNTVFCHLFDQKCLCKKRIRNIKQISSPSEKVIIRFYVGNKGWISRKQGDSYTFCVCFFLTGTNQDRAVRLGCLTWAQFWEKLSLICDGQKRGAGGGRICTFTSALSLGVIVKRNASLKGFHTGVGVKGVVPR